MCNPTIGMMAVSAVSAGLQYKMGKAQQEAAYARDKRQNELARKNAIIRYASAQLKIRQELEKSAQADLRGTLKARKARATYIAGVGDAGGLALSGSTNALLIGYFECAVVFTIVNPKNKPVAIFGINDVGNNVGAIWLLATDKLKDIQYSFLRENKKVIDFLNTKYKILWNFVDCRNSLHIKWLKWCGFKFIRKTNYGVLQKPFYEIIRINNV